MKKIVLAAFLFAISTFIFSCSKSNSNPSYGLSFDENGTHRVFADSAHVDTVFMRWGYSLANSEMIKITAYSGAESFGIVILDYDYPIAVANYPDTNNYAVHHYEMSTFLSRGNNNNWVAGFGVFSPTDFAAGTKHFNVNITALHNGLVSGTFSGDMALENDWDLANNIHVTNGRFTLKINQNYN